MIGNIKIYNTLGITYLTSPNAQNGKRMRFVLRIKYFKTIEFSGVLRVI